MRMSRTPEIMADAAHAILTKDAKSFTGNFLIDDTVLAEAGVTDFDRYRVDPTQACSRTSSSPTTASRRRASTSSRSREAPTGRSRAILTLPSREGRRAAPGRVAS